MTQMRTGRPGLMASLVILSVAIAVAILRPAFQDGWNPHALTGRMSDFALATYYPSRAFLEGVNPYDRIGYLAEYPVEQAFAPYSPAILLFHLPFALLPYHESALAYMAVSVVLVILLAWLALRFSGSEQTAARVLLIAALIVLSRPGRQDLILGQPAIEFILGSYVGLYYARRAPLISGLGLAASLCKPSFGLPMAALMLARSDRAAVLRGVGISILFALPISIILAVRAGSVGAVWGDLVATVTAQPGALVNNPATSSLRVDAASLISRIVGYPLNEAAQVAVLLVVLTLSAIAIRHRVRSAGEPDSQLTTSIICLGVLLSVYHQAYDLLLLAWPFVAVALRRLPPTFGAVRLHLLLLGLYTLLAANYFASYSVLWRLHLVAASGENAAPTGGLWLFLVSVNGVALVLLFALYFVGVLRRPSTGGPI